MSTPKIYLALYKGRARIERPYDLLARFSDWLTRRLTKSPYSHCEIAIPISGSHFDCYSSSIRDGGVRCKTMSLPADKWDLIELPGGHTAHARLWFIFTQTQGRRYDWLGAIGIVAGTRQNHNKWFCSEWCAYVLDYAEPWRLSPGSLAARLVASSKHKHKQ